MHNLVFNGILPLLIKYFWVLLWTHFCRKQYCYILPFGWWRVHDCCVSIWSRQWFTITNPTCFFPSRCRWVLKEGDQGHLDPVRQDPAGCRPSSLRVQEVRWTRSPCPLPEVLPLTSLHFHVIKLREKIFLACFFKLAWCNSFINDHQALLGKVFKGRLR